MAATSLVTGVRLYALLLGAASITLLAWSASVTENFGHEIQYWLLLTAAFGASEYVDVFFHHERGRQSISPSEAILVPMLMALSFGEVVWGVGAAIMVVATSKWRVGGVKWIVNVGNYVCSVAIAYAFWDLLSSGGGFTLRNAVASVAAVVIFAVMSYFFIAAAIALSEQRSIFKSLTGVADTAVWSLAGSATLGLLFAAAYTAAHWTVFLFPLPLAGLFLGYRAVLRQRTEKERLEHLHGASRALATAPDLQGGLVAFLEAVSGMASARESRVAVLVKSQWFLSVVRGGEVIADLQPVDGATELLLSELRKGGPSLLSNTDDIAGETLRASLGATSIVAVPLLDHDEMVGALAVLDRVGADDFGDREVRLLQALANELVLTLDSYRLFEEIAEERERFARIFSGSKEGICLLDDEGVIKAWNPALAKITGFVEEEILGYKWSERILVRDKDHRRVDGMAIIDVSPEQELELVTRQGPPRWVSILSGPVQSGDETQWVLIVRDITAMHEIEEAKSDFLSTISHELRTPLTTIKGSLQMLGRPAAAPQSDIGKQMIEIMKRGSDRLERLVMNLLAVSQMEAGSFQVYPDEVALTKLVRSRIDPVLPDHPNVEIIAEEDEIIVRADRERLVQVIDHLLDNAQKFGDEGGKITVDIAKEHGYAHFSVTDEGPGVPKIDQERIFQRFVRLGHVLTRETQGPGVGLYIAKKALEAMGGEIWVESEGSGGSTFHVRVPLAHPMAVADAPASA